MHEHTGIAKITKAMDATREHHRAMTEAKHTRIAAKKNRQARKGWPADKSPI